MSDKPTIASLKDALLDALQDQVANGVKVVNKDGEEVTLPAGAPVLAVAAKFVKDWANEIENAEADRERTEKLAQFLERKRPDLVQGTKPN